MRIFGYVVLIVIALVLFSLIGSVLGWFGQAKQVAEQEFSPRALFDRYQWFKDAAAQLDKKRADIPVYNQRIKAMDTDYIGIQRSRWPRDDREQYNVWRSESAGVKASFNQLAAEYNAAMAKINWQFANVGQLPQGATEPLPREFKPYEVQ